MADSDNKKLDLLLSLRGLIQNEVSVMTNNFERINSFYLRDHDDESNRIYCKLKDHILRRYEKEKHECKELLQDLSNVIDRTCCHEYVDDEIEHVYSGNLVKIRYCCICEKTV